MRAALLLIVAITMATACSGDAKPPRAGTQIQQPAESVAYIDMGSAEKLVKHFPVDPGPTDDAEDQASCERAGGDWDDFYLLGVLILREPEEDAEHAGKRCWSKRRPARLADAGKPCRGQADCIGNCLSKRQEDGKWSSPRCQAQAEDAVCGSIYDAGQYHWIGCPIP